MQAQHSLAQAHSIGSKAAACGAAGGAAHAPPVEQGCTRSTHSYEGPSRLHWFIQPGLRLHKRARPAAGGLQAVLLGCLPAAPARPRDRGLRPLGGGGRQAP